MVPICFNVSVYLMDATRQRMEKSIISKEDKCRIQDEAVRTSDTSLLDELVLVNPISVSATIADKEDIKASEIYDASQNLAKNNDGNFSSTGVFPTVQFDNESSKENQSEVKSPHSRQNADLDFSTTRVFPNVTFDKESNKENPTAKTSAVEVHVHSEAIIDNKSNMDEREIDKVANIPIQDAFIFCPMTGTFVLNETLEQGIFASETEIDQTEANKNSIVNRFITINFEEKDAN